jgi:hypothetical protein
MGVKIANPPTSVADELEPLPALRAADRTLLTDRGYLSLGQGSAPLEVTAATVTPPTSLIVH